jgi:hypothetical protein
VWRTSPHATLCLSFGHVLPLPKIKINHNKIYNDFYF